MKIRQAAILSGIAFSTALMSSAAFAGGCGGAGHAHSAQEMAEKYFASMDANSDSVVSEAEFKASPMTKFVKNFDALGPNAEGLVEKEAFVKMFVDAHSDKGSNA